MIPSYVYRATVNRVIDGDTFVFNVDLGFRIFAAITVRLRGVFAPESHEEGGTAATARARTLLLSAQQITLATYKDQQTFARWVADVYIDGRSLAEILAGPPQGIGAREE